MNNRPLALLLAVATCAATAGGHAADAGRGPGSPPEPRGPRLRELAPTDGSFPMWIGATTNYPDMKTETRVILDREFAFVTPANSFKQSAICRIPGKLRWGKADEWVAHCERNDQLMRLHSPISPQCSPWAREDDRTAEELEGVLVEYMTALCKRYNGTRHVVWMDVVNETVTREGEWFGPKPGTEKWENPWTKIGFDKAHPLRPPLYIKRAFEIANRHAPDIKQIINQHGDMEKPMWRKIAQTALYLRGLGLRVDGIGWQAHIDVGFEEDPEDMASLNDMITWCHRNRLAFHITECNVWLRRGREGDYEAQARTFDALVRTLLAHSGRGTVSWNAWGIRDNETQHPEWEGCLFRDDGSPKPAYYAIQRTLRDARSKLAR